MKKTDYEVQVLVNGKPVKETSHHNRTYIESRIGTEYTLKIRNSKYSRVMAVITVDGINVVTGLPGTSSKNEAGYIVPACSSVDIKGFRKDLDTVGNFKFCQKSKSYCNEAGAPGNNGVIGVRIYSEKYEPENWINKKLKIYEPFEPAKPFTPPMYYRGIPNDYSTVSKSAPSYSYCSSKSSDEPDMQINCVQTTSNAFGVGTTWGQVTHDHVDQVTFKVDEVVACFEIYYLSLKGMQKLGIPIKKEKALAFPQAFDGFANPPKGWEG